MKILVTGSDSMLAADLVPIFKDAGHEVSCKDHRGLDITNFNALVRCIGEADPEVLINTAAYTAVDKAESEEVLAARVNTAGAETIAMACKTAGVSLVHVSTDFVFDGAKGAPYTEEDEASPVGAYGRTKYDGELRVKSILPDALIIRTSWLYGPGGNSFARTITRFAAERETIEVVNDQMGTPTYTADMAAAVAALVGKGAKGLFNFSNDGECTWFDYAVAIVEELKERGKELKVKDLVPVTTEQYGAPAPRPSYSVLSKKKYVEATGMEVPHWRDALKRYMDAALG